jgi:hypothetical protein
MLYLEEYQDSSKKHSEYKYITNRPEIKEFTNEDVIEYGQQISREVEKGHKKSLRDKWNIERCKLNNGEVVVRRVR